MIVLVEDDPDFRDETCAFFDARGFEITAVADGDTLRQVISTGGVELVLLDVMLRDSNESGLEIARRLRRELPEIGIVMLTCLDQPIDQVRGLDTGVDSYLAKGGDLMVLEATVRNVLDRRKGVLRDRDDAWALDRTKWSLTAPNGKRVTITNAELTLLSCLMTRHDAPVARSVLLSALDKPDDEFTNRNLDNIVRRLRRKVESEAQMELPLRSAYGKGYAFTARGTLR